ncbi:uncharacterized protein LOC106177802 [Lingula anatina]|uniref:Uncharacterized protein LOC106177802 n=1 Tax=Lingula anatina TaxID=7574 RepID=A0A1S3K189_LINAN|nr:uncharacterized protein LOC106177802 [Lingula anatina]XP_013416154.1 uncharacterized protein LOC106177802 [Lingula anatina]|eukprot:XP_013416153.1 uncharacterized protein LOC106177802 [Lingula anatina]
MTITERYEGRFRDNIGKGIYVRTDDDNMKGPSIEDREFMELMKTEMQREESGHLIAPLPFKHDRKILPNNKERVYQRLRSLSKSLRKNQELKDHYVTFMSTMLEKGHAEPAPPLRPGQEAWYLPHFGVYHAKKPGKIRVVFDSSDTFNGTSLNDVLLTGPDLLNNLLGVLLRFRSDLVACMADIEQMFYSFHVKEEHRDFLRFLWFENNDPEGKVEEYRMKVHIFGNSPSPAVATFGLRKTAQEGQQKYGKDARQFVENDFYCDDGLLAVPTVDKAIDILKQTKDMLAVSNLRLHKIASNFREVVEAFPASERAAEICDLNLDLDEAPLQRSLGILWNLQRDTFTFQVTLDEKPFTKRGVLSAINSIYDPLGFVQPVVIGGKVLLRQMTQNQEIGWDDRLPDHLAPAWHLWRQSLLALAEIEVPRAYTPIPSTEASRRELHVFSDASQQAIAAVAYLKVIDNQGNIHVSFLMGKAKLAPKHATSIPRLELNSAVLAVELRDVITSEIQLEIHEQRFYSDSRVVLGYLTNRTKRFYVYVANRVERILRSTSSEQWTYVPTNVNPADHATRPVTAEGLPATSWLQGPGFLKSTPELDLTVNSDKMFLVSDDDVEVRPDTKVYVTSVLSGRLPMHLHFTRFSSWNTLVRSIARLIRVVRCLKATRCRTRGVWHVCPIKVQDVKAAEKMILHNAQKESYSKEICVLKQGHTLPSASSIASLNPFLDDDQLLRVGGRLKHADVSDKEKNPFVVPGDSHVSTLLIRHHHERVQHQGRHFTEGAVRNAGLWIIGAKRKIGSLIHKCVTCRKLRGKFEQQQMADLPSERLEQQPPFTNVGVDVFGPWEVVTRRTRGGSANSKRWAVLFTCFSTRAVHIEVIESMSASCFINALRRFFAIRGPAKMIRSDRGTNFVGAAKEMEYYLRVHGCRWEFNPPHASHMGGSWERMIGLARRILNSMLSQPGKSNLTHEILTTLMAEVSAIINARPLVPITTDPEAPIMLTPSMLLNQKICEGDDMGDFSDVVLYRQQWKRVQALADQFWARWRKEYLVTLQPRKKWNRPSPNLKLGDVVLIKDNSTKRNQWPMGIVINTFPSQDGLVRRVEVKTGHGSRKYLRPVTDIVVIVEAQVEIEE